MFALLKKDLYTLKKTCLLYVGMLLFGLVFEGIPVVTGEPYARFEFQDGQLVTAVVRLRRYTASGKRQYVLPAAQAAAASPRKGQRLGIAYVEGEDGSFAPERCFTFVEE